MPPENPFHYTHAIEPDEFVGREFLISALLSELRRGTSALLVGATRSGRTSILRRLEHGLRAPCPDGSRVGFTPLFLDAQTLHDDAGEADFWRLALRRVPAVEAAAAGYIYEAVDDLFADLARRALLPVLLIDHIDALLSRPNLTTRSFFGRLRAMSAGPSELAIVATSEISAAKINSLLPCDWRGSPFNHMLEYVLGPVDRGELDVLLDRGGDRFGPEDRDFIATISACHLYFAQVLAGCLWVFNLRGRPSPQRRAGAAKAALELCDATFDARWRSWSVGDRTLILTCALAELGSTPDAHADEPGAAEAPSTCGVAHELAALLAKAYAGPELRHLLSLLGDGTLQRSLPVGSASDAEVFAGAAELVMRHGVAEPLIRQMVRDRPRLHVEIHCLARTLGIHSIAVPYGRGLITVPDYPGLVRSGVLTDEGSTIRLRPPMLLWWLIDRMRSLARGDVKGSTWFETMALGDNSPALNESLHDAIKSLRALLREGSRPFIVETARCR